MRAVQLGAGEKLIELIAIRTPNNLLEGDEVRADPTQLLIDGLGSPIIALEILNVESEHP
jgi:hypothetical protein